MVLIHYRAAQEAMQRVLMCIKQLNLNEWDIDSDALLTAGHKHNRRTNLSSSTLLI